MEECTGIYIEMYEKLSEFLFLAESILNHGSFFTDGSFQSPKHVFPLHNFYANDLKKTLVIHQQQTMHSVK